MNISELSIRRPVLASVLTIIILLFGLIGYSYLGVREFPSVDNPIISVSCSYPGANADVIENQITEPLEQNINGIPGIRSLSSVSSQGQSRITVEFELSVDLETAANDVRDKVSRAQRYLPRDCDPPTVTKADALHHPTWEMGAKITIDSATMINKGFEVIEAKWLFGVEPRQIQVLVHPQSIVHSAVQFCDGAVKAQLGVPDMRLPIQYAFSFPERIHLSSQRLDLFSHKLEFFEPDMEKFRCLSLAFDAIGRGGNMPCILNAANEVANRGFLDDRCGFLQMGDVIAETMNRVSFDPNPSYETYVATDAEARRVAAEIMQGGMRP